MSLGTMGFIFSLSALAKIAKLEKQLTETGVTTKMPQMLTLCCI